MRSPSPRLRGVPRRTTRIPNVLRGYSVVYITCAGLSRDPLFLSAGHEEHDADADRAEASPQRHVYRLFLLHRELQRPDFRLMRFFGVTELLINETQCTRDDEHDGHDFDGIHVASFG